MGCGASKPVATEVQTSPAAVNNSTIGAPTPEGLLKRQPSAPIIKIDANSDPSAVTSASVPTINSVVHDPSLPESIQKATNVEAVIQDHTVPVGDVISKTAADGGVKAILELMRNHAGDAEYQWWCCDALASLCAGNEENRAAVYVGSGVIQILAAMKLFTWDENVQTKANWALANIAASYADYVGKQGGVEAIVSSMQSCPESYQVQISGTRALQNLITTSDINKVRAKQAGAIELLQEALERNPEDGQLQWRGQQLLQRLESVSEKDMQRYAPNTEVARNSPWSRVKAAIFHGQAKNIAVGNIPGLHGISAQVAEKAREGIKAVLDYMREHKGYHEAQTWGCDAISTLCNGNDSVRIEAFQNGAIDIIFDAMRSATWDEDLQLKALWALLSLAPTYPVEIGSLGDHMQVIVAALFANRTNHQVQVTGVKLLSLLTIEPSGENIRKAREHHVVRVIKSTIAAHTEDGTLQYRGVNLLERLQPGCTLEMPKQAMIRSFSMRAEEMVSQYRIQRVSSSHEGGSNGDSQNSEHDRKMEELSKNAIQEVDEMAENVEEHDQDIPPAGEQNLPGQV